MYYIDVFKYKQVVKEIHIVIAQIHYSSINKATCIMFMHLFFSDKLNENTSGTKSEIINSLSLRDVNICKLNSTGFSI